MNRLTEGLVDKTALVVGCGGLGCNVVEYLARSLIGRLIIVDGDIFKPSNMNRQLYCNMKTLGRYKVMVAAERVEEIGATQVIAIDDFFPTGRLGPYSDEIDIIMDCTDNIKTRLELEEYAENLHIPMVHGAINGTVGQVTTIMPSDKTLSKLYRANASVTGETMAFVPSIVASMQAAEAVKVLNNLTGILRGELLLIDIVESIYHKLTI